MSPTGYPDYPTSLFRLPVVTILEPTALDSSDLNGVGFLDDDILPVHDADWSPNGYNGSHNVEC